MAEDGENKRGRGRPPLSEEEKNRRAKLKADKSSKARRGRPPLSKDERLRREELRAVFAPSPKKRGRPRKDSSLEKVDETKTEKPKKRGRPVGWSKEKKTDANSLGERKSRKDGR